MKLRIHHQSIRFRLSQLDVEQFMKVGELEHDITLSVTSDALFRIRLRRCGSQSNAYMDGNSLCVDIADYKCRDFEQSDIITVEDNIDVSKGNSLHILVEKDLGCFKHFPNPLSDIAAC